MAFFLAGCTAFQDYNEVLAPARSSLIVGDFAAASQSLLHLENADEVQDLRSLPLRLELAMVSHFGGDFRLSRKSLEMAEERVRYFENRATFSASEMAEGLGTLLINEGAAPYTGLGFEKILIPTFQALNYLMLGDLEGALVEARRSVVRQEEEARKHREELEVARKNAERDMQEWNRKQEEETHGPRLTMENQEDLQRAIEGVYGDMRVPGMQVNAYQNAFTHALAAMLFRADGDMNAARIELKRALALRPGRAVLTGMLLDTLAQGGFREELARYCVPLGLSPNSVDANRQLCPYELYVIWENGWSPQKTAVNVQFPTPYGLVRLSIPKYKSLAGDAHKMLVSLAGESTREVEELAHLEAQAYQALRDKMQVYVIKMAFRLIIRLAGERAMQQKLTAEMGEMGYLTALAISSAANVVLERADLRGWTFLPRRLHMTHLRLSAPQARLRLQFHGGNAPRDQRIVLNLKKERPGVVLVRSFDRQVFVHTWP